MAQGSSATSQQRTFWRCPYFIDDILMLLVLVPVVLACGIALRSVGIHTVGQHSWLLNAQLYLAVIVAIFAIELSWLLAVRRPERPIRPCLFYLRRRPCLTAIPRSLPLLGGVVVFMCLFSVMKGSIPRFHAYQWDATLIALDRSIHGDDPWRLLQPLVGYPVITAALAQIYHVWILLIYVGAIYVALYVSDKPLRRQFFASFFSIWFICGTLLAICFASVGPCFVGRLLGNPYYAEQMAYLRMANTHYPVAVLQVQDQLTAWTVTNSQGLGRGISAMPSMHVSLAFLFFLAMRKVSRKAGWFFGAFFVVILIGSVHLGYHYAVDGYVSILVTLLIWKVAGLWPAHEERAQQPDTATPASDPAQQALA